MRMTLQIYNYNSNVDYNIFLALLQPDNSQYWNPYKNQKLKEWQKR